MQSRLHEVRTAIEPRRAAVRCSPYILEPRNRRFWCAVPDLGTRTAPFRGLPSTPGQHIHDAPKYWPFCSLHALMADTFYCGGKTSRPQTIKTGGLGIRHSITKVESWSYDSDIGLLLSRAHFISPMMILKYKIHHQDGAQVFASSSTLDTRILVPSTTKRCLHGLEGLFVADVPAETLGVADVPAETLGVADVPARRFVDAGPSLRRTW